MMIYLLALLVPVALLETESIQMEKGFPLSINRETGKYLWTFNPFIIKFKANAGRGSGRKWRVRRMMGSRSAQIATTWTTMDGLIFVRLCPEHIPRTVPNCCNQLKRFISCSEPISLECVLETFPTSACDKNDAVHVRGGDTGQIKPQTIKTNWSVRRLFRRLNAAYARARIIQV